MGTLHAYQASWGAIVCGSVQSTSPRPAGTRLRACAVSIHDLPVPCLCLRDFEQGIVLRPCRVRPGHLLQGIHCSRDASQVSQVVAPMTDVLNVST